MIGLAHSFTNVEITLPATITLCRYVYIRNLVMKLVLAR